MTGNDSTSGPSRQRKVEGGSDSTKIYLFGWPGFLGGAETKIAHLMRLLRGRYPITVVPPRKRRELSTDSWTKWMEENRVRYCALEDLPDRLRGWGVSLCDSEFVGSVDWVDLRRRGLKMAWGNEMMWPLPRESGAIALGQIDTILYVSAVQRAALEPYYQRLWRGTLQIEAIPPQANRLSGWITGRTRRDRLRWVMVGNYIDPSLYPFRDRALESRKHLTIGRLSRADPSKFPFDFPDSYEGLGLRHPRFRVMGWSARLQACWPGHRFDHRWELLPPSPATATFLQSLDLFVYEVGPCCRESWCRAVVEAMLTGAIPLLPRGGGHHLENLVEHGESGYLFRNRTEFRRYAQYLQDHPAVRFRMSRQCRETAVRRWCDVRCHVRVWDKVFHGC